MLIALLAIVCVLFFIAAPLTGLIMGSYAGEAEPVRKPATYACHRCNGHRHPVGTTCASLD